MGGLAIACPGQGGQHPQMFALALQSSAGSGWLAEYSDALEIDVQRVAQQNDDLFCNRNAQLLICGAAGATWAALQALLPVPEVFIGYSVGELAAYGCAGAWTAREIARIALQRAAMMDLATPQGAGLMAVKGLTEAPLLDLCRQLGLEIAIVNGDDHFVVGGLRVALEQAAHALSTQGHWCKVLDVAVPSHTSAMRDAAERFGRALRAFPVRDTAAPVLAGIDGCPTSASTIAPTLAAQIAQCVRWDDCMKATAERGVDVVLELGPGASLSRMFAENGSQLQARSVDDFRTLDGIVKWVDARLR
ncbi:MAG: malonate decarboxylase subunit epsilon [Herminiimonas sp.]|nr:malonate decarboxylase subunit epsilon [Herminiimonas sp.]